METSQIRKKIFMEDIETSQIINIIIRETQILNVIDQLLKTAGNCIRTSAGVCSVENIKYNGIIVAAEKITLHHGQFIQVGHHRQIVGKHNYYSSSPIRIVDSPNLVMYSLFTYPL